MSQVKDNLNPQEREYQMKYGGLPSDRDALLQYVQEKYPFNQKALDTAMARCEQTHWQEVEFILYLIPTPTPRPRSDGHHFYVKGAAQNKKLIKKFIKRHIIATRCETEMCAYLPIPTSVMSNAEIYLAEKGIIVPLGSADVDNLMKTYLDMMQGHLLLNDNIVTSGFLEKRYSIKPRLELKIRYQTGYDSKYNERRITKSKGYIEEFGNTSL